MHVYASIQSPNRSISVLIFVKLGSRAAKRRWYCVTLIRDALYEATAGDQIPGAAKKSPTRNAGLPFGKITRPGSGTERCSASGTICVMDRAYIDFARLYVLTPQLGFFRGAHQVSRAVATALLACGGQEYRRARGPDGGAV